MEEIKDHSITSETSDNFLVTRVTYELYIMFVTIMALGVTVAYYWPGQSQQVREVMKIVDWIFAVQLLVDFFLRLTLLHQRNHYFLRLGWLDLLSGLPAVPLFRLFRLPRLLLTILLLRRHTPRQVLYQARSRLAESSLFILALFFLLVITVGSSLVVTYEAPAANSDIKTGQEAVWWAVVTMATVGYGDYAPVTSQGRMVAVVMMILGVGIFSVLTSYLSSFVLFSSNKNSLEMDKLRDELAEIKSVLEKMSKGDSP